MPAKNKLFLIAILLAVILLTSCSDATVSLTISATPAPFTAVDQQITVTYEISNPVGVNLENIQVKDGEISVPCPSTVLQGYSTMTCTRVHTITAADVTAGKVVFSGKVTAWGYQTCGDACGADNRGEVSATDTRTIIYRPILTLAMTKTSDLTSFTQAGEQVTYTYTVTNSGTGNIMNPVSVQDDLVEVTCPALGSAGLAPGGSITCQATYTVTLDDLRAGIITNSAVATSGTVTSNTATLSLPVNAQPSLTLEKVAVPASYNLAGETITYTLTITNSGNVPLTGPLVINDPLAQTWICSEDPVVELLPGASMNCTSTFDVSANTVGTSFANSATVSLNYLETVVTSNEATATVYYLATNQVDCTRFTTQATCIAQGCAWNSTLYICGPKP